MPSATKNQLRIRRLLWAAAILALLEFFPGSYVIEDFQDEWDPDSPEGLALLALDELTLSTLMEFDRPTRQRISRNAELLVPADTRITLNASMNPLVEGEEVVAKPRTWKLESDRSLTFVYRGVTVARAKRMEIRSDDPALRVRAMGTYSVLSALATAHRYHRQREIKRAYLPPDRAVVDVDAVFLPDHVLTLTKTLRIQTGITPSDVTLSSFTWDQGTWTDGSMDLNLTLANPEPFLNALAKEMMTEPIEVGGFLAIKFRRLHAMTFIKNGFFVHLDGSITSSNSRTIEGIFDPSFETRLEFAFTFPEGQTLEEAEFGARLKQIHSFDINNTNNLLDKSVRNIARGFRDDLTYSFPVAPELPDNRSVPRNLVFDVFSISGTEDEGFRLDIEGHFPSPEEKNLIK